MRVPKGRIYRAFPELDPFTDEQCRGFVKRAMRRHILSSVLIAILCIVVVIPLCGVAAYLVGVLMGSILQSGSQAAIARFLRVHPDTVQDFSWVLWVAVSLLSTFVICMMIRDSWLRWAVRKQIWRARCPRCDYTLIGLAVTNDAVTCPECGDAINLQAIGLTTQDLIAKDPSAAPSVQNSGMTPPVGGPSDVAAPSGAA